MPENTRADTTDSGTRRPDAPEISGQGTKFIPMKIPRRYFKIHLPEGVSPNDPISIFLLYYPPKIIDIIVQRTNEFNREPEHPDTLFARANNWFPTSRPEIYTYLGMRIYMMINPLPEIADYWSTSKLKPQHPISERMSRDRFQELHIRYRIHSAETKGTYRKACFSIGLRVTN